MSEQRYGAIVRRVVKKEEFYFVALDQETVDVVSDLGLLRAVDEMLLNDKPGADGIYDLSKAELLTAIDLGFANYNLERVALDTHYFDVEDLMDVFDVDAPDLLSRRIYKETGCGASLSLYHRDRGALHPGDDWRAGEEWDDSLNPGFYAFSIQTIVEGSDNDYSCGTFHFPVSREEVDKEIDDMEQWAADEWDRCNLDEGDENEEEEQYDDE